MPTDTHQTNQQVPKGTSIPAANSVTQGEVSAHPVDGQGENGSGRRQEKDYLKEKRAAKASAVRKQGRWKPLIIISNAVAILALILSYLGVQVQRRSIEEGRKLAYDSATQEIIHNQYELCRELDRLRVERPELSHLLALPTADPDDPWKTYRVFKEKVRNILSDGEGTVSVADSDKFFLQEHAVALHVFDIYEQTVYQWQAAAAVKDNQRTQVLKMLVDYYEGRMLRNPRLRYHWNHGGSDMLEEDPTRKRYNQYVMNRYPNDYVDNDSPLDFLLSRAP